MPNEYEKRNLGAYDWDRFSDEDRKFLYDALERKGFVAPRKDGVLTELGQGVAYGGLGALKGLGATLEETTGYSGMKEYFGDVMRQNQQFNPDPSYKALSLNPANIARTIGSGAAQSTLALGGAVVGGVLGGGVGGVAASTAMMFGQIYGDRVQEYREAFPNEDEDTVAGLAFLSSLGESFIESLIGPEQLATGIAKKWATGALKETTKDLVKSAGKEAAKGLFKQVVKEGAKNFATEGLEEVSQDLWDRICRSALEEEGLQLPSWEEVGETFMGGAWSGLALGGVGGAVDNMTSRGKDATTPGTTPGKPPVTTPATPTATPPAPPAGGAPITVPGTPATSESAPITVTPEAAPSEESLSVAPEKDETLPASVRLAAAVAKETGINLHFFDEKNAPSRVIKQNEDGTQILADAWYDKDSNEFWLNRTDPESGVMELLGHEFKHYLDKKHGDLVSRFNELIRQGINATGQEEANRVDKQYENADQGKGHGLEEISADEFGRMWQDPDFWRDVASRAEKMEAGMGQKFIAALQEFVNTLRKKLNEIGTPEAKQMFDNLGELREEAVKIMAEIKQQQNTEKKSETTAEQGAQVAPQVAPQVTPQVTPQVNQGAQVAQGAQAKVEKPDDAKIQKELEAVIAKQVPDNLKREILKRLSKSWGMDYNEVQKRYNALAKPADQLHQTGNDLRENMPRDYGKVTPVPVSTPSVKEIKNAPKDIQWSGMVYKSGNETVWNKAEPGIRGNDAYIRMQGKGQTMRVFEIKDFRNKTINGIRMELNNSNLDTAKEHYPLGMVFDDALDSLHNSGMRLDPSMLRPMPQTTSEQQAPAKPSSEWGANNSVVKADAYEEAKKRMKDRLRRMNVGFDPGIISDGAIMAAYHIEAGARKFTDFSKRMITDLGDAIKPYLKSIYESARRFPGMESVAKDMDSTEYVDNFDLEKIGTDDIVNTNPETRGEPNERDTGDERTLPAKQRGDADSTADGGSGKGNRTESDTGRGASENSPDGNGQVLRHDDQPGDTGTAEESAPGRGAGDGLGESGVRSEQGTQRVDESGSADSQPVVGDDVSGRTESDNAGGRGPAGGTGRNGESEQSGRNDAGGSVSDVISGETDPNKKSHRIGKDDVLIVGGDKAKIKANLAAIKLVKKLEKENREATPEEKKVLAQYVGWGGLKNVFEPASNMYVPQLKDLLTPDEYRDALRSVRNAHYTERAIIEKMWSFAEKLGFKGGAVGEFGAGVGHFLGLVPDNLASKTKFRAVELDSITGRILKKLYPEANVTVAGLENTKIPNGSLSMVIGNVPFDDIKIRDSRYGESFTLHNYFLARSIDAVRPGGLVISITSHGTMDSIDQNARKYFEEKADFLGAIRLPSNAFMKNAGTAVVTDILVFRKKDGSASSSERFVRTRDFVYDDETVPLNEYFVANPDMMLGKPSIGHGMYANNSFLLTSNSKDLSADVDNAMDKIVEAHPAKAVDTTTELPTDTSKVNLLDGELYIENGKVREWHVSKDGTDKSIEIVGKSDKANKKNLERVAAFQKLKAVHNALINAMNENCSDAELSKLQAALKEEYDKFVKAFGNIADRTKQRILKEDPTYLRASGLENIKIKKVDGKEIEEYSPSDVFTKRTIMVQEEPTHASNAKEATEISIKFRGKLDPDYMEQLTGKNWDDIKDELTADGTYYEDPDTGMLVEKSEYLSGNIKEKLEKAEYHAADNKKFAKNVDALKAAMPAPKKIDEFTFKLGTRWIPTDFIEQWINSELGGRRVSVYYDKASDRYTVDGWLNNPVYTAYGYSTDQLLQSILSMKKLLVYDKITDPFTGDVKSKVNQEKTQAVEDLKKRLAENFHDWVKRDPKNSSVLEKVFNENVNIYVSREMTGEKANEPYPGAAAEVDGNKILLRSYQRNAVSRMMRQNTLLAHCVGAGKTATMITSAMELVRTGMAHKPLIVVQNATLGQFSSFAAGLYPSKRILCLDRDSFTRENRQRTASKIANNEWDLIIMPQSQFNRLGASPEAKRSYYEDILDELKAAKERATRDRGSRRSVRDLAAQIKSFEEKIRRLDDKLISKDNAFYFEELGVDALYIDEAHAYKKPFFATNLSRLKGLNTSTSERALDLSIKIDGIMKRNGGKNIFFATGTPVTNTLAEVYHMVRYLTPKGQMPYGCETFDQFVSMFCEVESTVEPNAAGTYRSVERLSKFVNLKELSIFFRSVADVVLPENLKGEVDRPPLKNGKPTEIIIEKSSHMDDFMSYLGDLYRWYNSLDSQAKKAAGPIPLIVNGLAVKATIDMRLVDPNIPPDAESKISRCAQEIKNRYDQFSDVKAAQAIFFDNFRYTDSASKKVTFNAYDEMKRVLVEMGIPENEIACIDKVKNDEERRLLFNDINDGKVRVVIGGTETLGTGANIQKRLVAIHNLDATYMPSGMEQRIGRIIRSGNKMKEVEIVNYAIKGTLDEVKYQLLARKQKFINSVLRGDAIGDFEDEDSDSIDYETFAARVSGNPLAIEFVELKNTLAKQNAQYQLYLNQQNQMREELDRLNSPSHVGSIEIAAQNVKDREAQKEKFQKIDPDNYEIEADGKKSTWSKEDFKKVLDKLIERGTYSETRMKVNGFDMTFTFNKEVDALMLKNGQHESVQEKVHSYRFEDMFYSAAFKSGAGFVQSYSDYAKKADKRLEGAKEELQARKDRKAELEKSIDTDTSAKRKELDETQAKFDELSSKLVQKEEKFIGGRPSLSNYIKGAAPEMLSSFDDILTAMSEIDDSESGVESEDEDDRSFKLTEPADSEEVEFYDGDGRSYKLASPEKQKQFDKEEKAGKYVVAYKSVQLHGNDYYAPMAARKKTIVNGKTKWVWEDPIQFGKWAEVVDDYYLPESERISRPKRDKNGNFIIDNETIDGKPVNDSYGEVAWEYYLDKGEKEGGMWVRRNPYDHSSPVMLNDQFDSAWRRDNLVTLEVHIPTSELESGYRAPFAKNKVGKLLWKAGIVQSKLSDTGKRTVYLSRYVKPVRIVPNDEVARHIKNMVKGKVNDLPSNVLPPALRAELEKIGVPIAEMERRGKEWYRKGTDRKYKIARGQQVNPIRVDGEFKDSYQVKLDNYVYTVRTQKIVNNDAGRMIAGFGGINGTIKAILDGDFKPASDTAQRAMQVVINSDEAKNLSDADADKIADAYMKSGTAAGQTLNARRLGAFDYTNMDSIRAHINAFLMKMGKAKAKTLRDDIIKKTGIDIDNLPEDIVTNPRKLDEVLRVLLTGRATRGDKFYEYWINSILSSPTTHVANTIGNVTNAAYELGAKRLAEAMIGSVARALGKNVKNAATFGEYKQMMRAIDWKEAWRRARFMFDVETLDTNSRFDMAHVAIGGKLGRAIRVPGRLLRAADEFAKAVVVPIEAAAFAYREGNRKGYSGEVLQTYIQDQLKDEKSDANAWGKQRSLELTFQERGKPGSAVNYLIQLKESGGISGNIMKIVLPFIKTPHNILRQGIRKSPLGVANLAWQTVQGIRGKRQFDAEYVSLAAEQLLAWGIVMALAGDGDDDEPIITGSSPRYGSAEQKFKANKLPPYSIRIGKNYYSYQRIEPLATGLAFIADGIQAYKAAKRGEDGQKIMRDLIGKTSRMVREKSFLDSVNTIGKIIEDPERSGMKWFTNFAASWSPNVVRHTINLFDDNVRDNKARDKGMNWFEEQFYTTMNAAGYIKASPRYDYFGRPVKKDSLADSGPLWQLMRLIPIQSVSPDDNMNRAEKLMWKYNMTHPGEEYYPDVPAYYFTRDGQKLYTTGQYWDELAQKSGQLALKQINNAFKHGLLNERKPTEKDIDLIKKIFQRARKEVRDEMYEKKHYQK